MATFFKKRRRGPSGPNKNEKKVLRRRPEASLRDLCPGATRLEIVFHFESPQGDPYEDIARDFSPGDPCDFSAPCPGRCGNGRFDLTDAARGLFQSGGDRAEERLVCREASHNDPATPCDFRLTCEIRLAR